jgi:hypothetical protein
LNNPQINADIVQLFYYKIKQEINSVLFFSL